MKWLTVFLLVCIAGFSQAQTTQKFVQVIVEDSVELEPDEFTFTVYVQYGPDYTSDSNGSPPSSEKNESSLKALQALIARMHIDSVPFAPYHIAQNDISLRSDVTSLRFTRREKLDEFIRSARSIPGLVGVISGFKALNRQAGEDALTQKLLTKARNRALFLASAAGKTLGSLLQMEDMSSSSIPSTGGTLYPPLSTLMGLPSGELNQSEYKIIITKKISVRYTW